jgi:hypothetical protein
MCVRDACGILRALGQAEVLLPQFSCLRQLPPYFTYPSQPPQDKVQLSRIPHLLAEHAGSSVGLFHLRGCLAFGGHEGLTEGELHVQFLAAALRGVGKGLEQL